MNTMVKKSNRKKIPERTRKLLQKEVQSSCPICDYQEVAELEIHHIDENIQNNDVKNLIMLCPNCHSKVTSDTIKKIEIIKLKESLQNKTNTKINSTDIESLKRIFAHLIIYDLEYVLHKYSSNLGFRLSFSKSIEKFFDSYKYINNKIYHKKLHKLLTQFVNSLKKYYNLYSDNSIVENGIVKINSKMKDLEYKKYDKIIKELDKLADIAYSKLQDLIDFLKLNDISL
jgi:hypothetical protein